MIDLDELSRALDAIERHEAQFLAWGIVDRSISEEDLVDLIESAKVSEAQDIRDELLFRNLVTRVRFTSPARYRSRMAEGVRLFAHLKQLFPNRPWEGAPNLVADFRFLVRPRRFARRDQTVDQLIERLGGPGFPPKDTETVHRLLGGGPNDEARLLSQFQVDATVAIMEGLRNPSDQACVVSAGTGQGKTLAFYLPALVHLAQLPRAAPATSVIAIYPRNELLKDQLLATLREVRRLQDHGRPSAIRIGTYFGPTPNAAFSQLDRYHGWEWSNSLRGYCCPFLVCPGPVDGDPCGGRLVWQDEDRKATTPIERLVCERCFEVIGDDLVTLTRNALMKRPADILFTTTESLNRRLPDTWNRHIFGIGPRAAHPPRLILLDEVHTYTGPTGAHTAYLLRRWRSQVKGPVMWVGLSATLRNAREFFSTVTGVDVDSVREIRPDPDQAIERGHEYQLLLRGDPVSQTALLSTSIQSLMLVLRLLDPLGQEGSGLLGHKVFAFCDNLNVINRLYRQLLDAEGRTPWGKIETKKGGSLALLRSERYNSSADNWTERDRQGQAWWIVDQIRDSATPPVVGRTSTQDSGVTKGAEEVVATASLEVGYDDPDVGAVLQHKAPRDVAQFVQRRGRAGRNQEMRPWTIVVLSDYGRDRLNYQAYEQLFDPLLPPKTLPVSNRSVQRMQATFALMDWLADRADRAGERWGNLRDELSAPLSELRMSQAQRGTSEQRITWIKACLASVLDGGDEREDLEGYLVRALDLSHDDIQLLLWQGPRAVLSEAVPTLLRRLESDWHVVVDGTGRAHGDLFKKGDPLPEFLPARLFSDLALPEITVVGPENYDVAADAAEPAFLALREFAPGNVTLRYAVEKTRGLWFDPRTADDLGALDVSESVLDGGEVICTLDEGDGQPIRVVRPFRLSPSIPEPKISESSSGRLRWQVQITQELGELEAPVPEGSPWRPFIDRVCFYVQAARGGLRVLRYARGGRAEIGVDGGRQLVDYSFHDRDEPVAIGIELDVDGVGFTVQAPDTLAGFRLDSDPARLRQLVADWFQEKVTTSFAASDTVNPFLARRMAELALAAVAHGVTSGELPSSSAAAAWDDERWRDEVLAAFERSLQSLRPTEEDRSVSPLRSRIEEVFQPQNAATILRAALASALAGPTEEWLPYLRGRFNASVAAAICAAAQSLLPEFDVDEELYVDVVDLNDGRMAIWLTETTVGGGGITEALYASYSEDPRQFWHIVASQLEAADTELTAEGLGLALRLIDGGSLADLARAYREAAQGATSLGAWTELMAGIGRAGAVATHSLSVALATRVFRAGSSEQSDAALAIAIDRWRALETEIGFALEHRTACSILAEDSGVATGIRDAAPGDASNRPGDWLFDVLLSMLWMSPESLRPTALQYSNPFVDDAPASERTLVLDHLQDDLAAVDVTQPWRAVADSILARSGRCTFVVPTDRDAVLRNALFDVVCEPVDVGALLLYPKITGLRRRGDRLEALIELNEAPQ